jgi:hypothetical protein
MRQRCKTQKRQRIIENQQKKSHDGWLQIIFKLANASEHAISSIVTGFAIDIK